MFICFPHCDMIMTSRGNLCWHLVTPGPDTWPCSLITLLSLPRAPVRPLDSHFRLRRVRVDFRWRARDGSLVHDHEARCEDPGALGKLWSLPDTISAWSDLNKLTSLSCSTENLSQNHKKKEPRHKKRFVIRFSAILLKESIQLKVYVDHMYILLD